jgi:hypothetical protein
MKPIFTHHDPTVVGFKKSILEQAGVACFIQNENTSASLGAGFLGLVQSPVFDPVLFVTDDARYEEALALLKSVATPDPAVRPDWRCPACGETVPGNFDTCWNCSQSAP